LAADCRLKVDPLTYDNPHTKVFLLMQAHMSHLALPNTDFGTDTKSVLDQAIRILQAMIDVAAERGWLATTLRIQLLMQSTIQARWHDESVFLCLPNVEPHNCYVFDEIKVDNCSTLTLPILKEKCRRNYEVLAGPLRQEFDEAEIEQIYKVLKDLPTVKMDFKIRGAFNELDNIERSIPQPPNKNDWLEVNASEEYTLIVNLQRLGARSSEYMHCPKFPKPKSEGWFLVLGCQENGELLAMKRCAYRANKSTHHLLFTTPNKRGRIIYTLYFVSDGYLGLDQQYNLQFQVLRERAGKFPQIDSIYDKL
jgi:activating signal cointegrator complex subunit 3